MYVCAPVMVLQSKCANGERACSLGADTAVGKEHGGLVKLLRWHIFLSLEVQGALMQKAVRILSDQHRITPARAGTAWHA